MYFVEWYGYCYYYWQVFNIKADPDMDSRLIFLQVSALYILNHDVFDLIFNIIYVIWWDQLKCSSK